MNNRIRPRLPRAVRLAVMAGVFAMSTPIAAQWLKYPTADVPRLPDGKPNMAAPAPRMADRKPDFSGLWLTDDGFPCAPAAAGGDFIDCNLELPLSRYGLDIGIGMPGGLPRQPWASELVKKRTADQSKDDPHARCLPDTFLRSYGLPHLQKFVHVPGLLVMLDEDNANYRQVFTDARPLPQDPVPAWNGYSSARWDGDALVVDSIGFRDDLWLDMAGNFLTSGAKVRERIRRPDFGHLQIEVTVDDPKAYTKPWTLTVKQRFVADTELVDEICLENEKSSQRMTGQPAGK